MKQIIQDLKSGSTILEDVPVPMIKDGHVLIKTYNSLVSLGTEKMLVDFGKANFFQKARQQPEKVKQVLEKIKSDGLKPTLEAVFRKLGEPLPLGYCNSGVVIGVGKGVNDFKIGDRVVSNGQHSEVVNIPQNLVAKIPDNVSFEDATFTVVGAIGLQGIRLLNPTFGSIYVVTGLGLIGLISAQLLKANGCRVIGLDFDHKKVKLAKKWNIESYQVSENNVVSLINELTDNIGVDGVLITASTKSNDVISESAQICRKRGKIVLVGVVGLDMNRSDMYEKEISFQVSCSYGPGRYDSNYEDKSMDYPIGFVRWTQKRNFEAILRAISINSLDVKSLITNRIKLADYQKIYNNLSNNDIIASIINYNVESFELSRKVTFSNNKKSASDARIGVIGAGNFTQSIILPTLNKLNVNLKSIASSKGLSGTHLAKKYKIAESVSDYKLILDDKFVDAVMITTRHNQHANQIIESLNSNKHVFVEKPLALNIEELEKVVETYKSKPSLSLTVGFNRRFSPFSKMIKKKLGHSNHPINIIATMNAGFIEDDHWVQDPYIGGGRIIGEACHYIDLISFFTNSNVKSVVMNAFGTSPKINSDNVSILLKYENGSQGVINYFSNGSKSYSKERIEIYDQNKNIILDNFRKIHFYGYNESSKKSTQDKGHFEQFRLWNEMIKNGGDEIIPFDSLVNTTKSSFACLESLSKNKWVDVK